MVPISADESAKDNFRGSRKRPYTEDSEEEEPYVVEYLADQPRDRFMLAAERLAGVLRELDKHTRTKLMIEIVRILNYREMLANAERTENTKHPRLSD